jgi:hypothetical protein
MNFNPSSLSIISVAAAISLFSSSKENQKTEQQIMEPMPVTVANPTSVSLT